MSMSISSNAPQKWPIRRTASMETPAVSVKVTLAKTSSRPCCGRLLAVSHTVKVIESALGYYPVSYTHLTLPTKA